MPENPTDPDLTDSEAGSRFRSLAALKEGLRGLAEIPRTVPCTVEDCTGYSQKSASGYLAISQSYDQTRLDRFSPLAQRIIEEIDKQLNH